MKTRIIKGAVLTAVLIPTLIFSHTPLFVIMLALFAFMGEYEMLHCLGLEKNIAISLPAYILAVGLPVGARYITNGMFMQYAFVAIAICFLWMLAAYTFSKGKVTLEQAGGAATGCVYVAVAFTAIILLRDIADTGKGLAKSYYKRIFEPGFTTKKRGWGLGLSLAKRIMEQYHKGRIFVKSSIVGRGTTIRLELRK